MSSKKKATKPAAEKKGATATATTTATADPAPRQSRTGEGLKVRATRVGYYDNIRRREGDTFTIKSEQEKGSWMEYENANVADKTTTGQEAINKQNAELLSERMQQKATGGANPLGAE